ncbi:putative antibiotic transporter [Wigglesworthia glossinidia endosymbiont of Glossina morsitans morsitans (Yale colony)]|uniref:UPF0056 membrane protein n=1 Tax=Wigglesworthia glossinidia endosymbiont of Glossina morsitans morsitans (Yale colony) TaxID=1142511 RepID=H6Q5V9_WIGGL|nr:MarC family protein [Wigglesworthia glossinidia]AFA41155.1 putative antibiotic transporter [Wigglesworthia glossinidia endosymbiont of Glossina morsitans morsitans (Yale colony)]
MNQLLSNVIWLFFIIDPFGNLPIVISMLHKYDSKKQRSIIVREMLIALIFMTLFLFFGKTLLSIFNLKIEIVSISGGIILFLMAIKMIFQDNYTSTELKKINKIPFVVPIAVPLLAGPGIFSTLIFLSQKEQNNNLNIFFALIIAWCVSLLVFLFFITIFKLFNNKGVNELERFMGLLLIMLSIQMFLDGIKNYFHIF